MQGRHAVELVDVQPRLLRQVGTHVLVADGRHPGDVGVVPGGREPRLSVRLAEAEHRALENLDNIPLHPVLIVGDVFRVQQLVGGRVLPQFVL